MFSESHNDRRRMDRRYLRERDTMLNSVLNGDWSNSVPGRQIPEGLVRFIKTRMLHATGLNRKCPKVKFLTKYL